MSTDDRTANQDYQLPHPTNLLEVDVYRLRNALVSIDANVSAILALLQSDNLDLDTVQELVDAIEANQADIGSLLGVLADAEAARDDAEAAAVAAAASAISAAGSATTATNAKNDFLERYFPGTAQPADPAPGDYPLWFDADDGIMKVWDGEGWVAAGSSIAGVREVFRYVAAGGATTFSGADIDGKVMTFDASLLVDVFLNGVLLRKDDTYTINLTTKTVSTPTAVDGDEITVIVLGNFEQDGAGFTRIKDRDGDTSVDTDDGADNDTLVHKAAGQVIAEGTSAGYDFLELVRHRKVSMTDVKTATYNAVPGDIVLCDTTGGAFQLTLPATPALNTPVVIADVGGNFKAQPLVVARNGQLIMGLAEALFVNVNYAKVRLVFSGPTLGWVLA